MKKAVVLLATLATLSMFVGTASAANVCFEWDCTSPLAQCDFDASCSSGFIMAYTWDFGDGNKLNWQSNAFAYHDYSETNPAGSGEYKDVTLELAIFSVGDISETCECGIRDIIGPSNPISGTCD